MRCIGHSLVVFVLRSAAALPAHEAARGAEYTKLARTALDGTACYDPRLFVAPSIDDKLLCTLCANVTCQARMVSENGDANGKDNPCNCVVGGGCLSKSLAVRQVCPSCSRPFVRSVPFAKLDREVASLRVKCHVAPDECAATGELGPSDRLWWRAHEAVCAFADVACPHCAAEVPRLDLEGHCRVGQCPVFSLVVDCCASILVALRKCPAFDSSAFSVAMKSFVALANPAVPISSAGCFAAIVKLMKNHKSTCIVQEIACHIVAGMCFDPANRPLAGAAGAVEAVLTALETHGADLDVATQACLALQNLVCDHPANQERAGAAGACEAVLKASKTHGADRLFAERVCGALMNLTSQHPANRERAGVVGAFTELTRLCNTHAAEADGYQNAFSAFVNLNIDHPANRQRAADAGVIELVIAVMARFPAHAAIQGDACFILDNFTSSPAHLPHVAAAGARAALAAALLAHPKKQRVKKWGALALARLPQ